MKNYIELDYINLIKLCNTMEIENKMGEKLQKSF